MADDQSITVFSRALPTSKRAIVSHSTCDHADKVQAQLEELVRLPTGWDGVRAKPVSLRNASYASLLLNYICETGTPLPSIVPGYRGDLQYEWHTAFHDIEIHVLGPLEASLWSSDPEICPDGVPVILNADVTLARSALKRMTEALNAADQAAA